MISYDDIKSGRAVAPAADDHGLALDLIQIDGGTQSRATLNDQVVNDYAEAIKAGATFPPIVVFYDGKKHWLADGFHRFHAYQKAGKAKVAADVRQGTRRDAILHSVGANDTHGLRRTRDDKRRAVLTLLNDSEWSAKPETWIAETCRVSRTLVRAVLAEQPHLVEKQDRSTVREVTRGGTTYSMQTASIGKTGDAEKKEITSQPVVPQGIDGGAEPRQSVEPVARTALESEVIDARTDAERRADAIQFVFDRASDEGRALFLARNNLRQESNPATATGGDDVTRSAERASSAVEVGAPVSPEGAQGSVPADTRLPSSLAAREADESAAPIPPSAAPTAEPEANPPSPPPASGNPFPDPHSQRLTTGGLHTSSDDAGAKGGVPRTVGQGGGEPGIHSQSEQQDASATQARNEPGSVSGATVTNSKPDCLHPDTCKLHFTSALCWSCNDARMRRAGA